MFVVVTTAVAEVVAAVVTTGTVDATPVLDGGTAESVDAHAVASNPHATVVTIVLCCFMTKWCAAVPDRCLTGADPASGSSQVHARSW